MTKDSSELVFKDKGNTENQLASPSPWLFVPTLYFAEGVPYVIINQVSVLFYKKLGIDNAQIALWTSFLYLPWIIKMFWGPLIDIYSTKRNWILYTQFAMMCCLSCLALSLQLPNFFFISLSVLAVGAFISATQDIVVDGFYMLTLAKEEQALFVGVRSTFYRIAMIFGSGGLVFLAGQLELSLKDVALSWTIAIGLSASVFAGIFIFHWFTLPVFNSDSEKSLDLPIKAFYIEIIQSYFKQEKIGAVIAFILLYRAGEAMLVKLTSPFLLDKIELGGLGLSTSNVGIIYGTVGAISLTLGGILGGVFVSKYGIQKCMWPMALALNLPNLFYVYMASTQLSIKWVYLLVSIEQFGYGLGTAAYSVYFMYLAKDEYKTTHFAISTGIMALGMMLPGLVSGYIQQAIGYQAFFILGFLLTIPGMLTIFFIPLDSESQNP